MLLSKLCSAGALVACGFQHWGKDKEEWRVFHPFSKHKLLTTDSGEKKSLMEKHLYPSILNLNKPSRDCANACCVFWPIITVQHTAFWSFERTNKTVASFSLPLLDLSPVFNPVTCKILDQDLEAASLFRGKIILFCLAVNRTNCNLVPKECHSRALLVQIEILITLRLL